MIIDICTVHYKNQELLDANIQYLTQLNKDINLRFIVINNSEYQPLPLINIKNIDGVNSDICEYKDKKFEPSIHHGVGLDLAMKHTNTDYIILMDPDCFFLLSITEIINYLEENNISIIGTPYGIGARHRNLAKSHYSHYSNFPACFFMIINRRIHNNFTCNFLKMSAQYSFDRADTSSPLREQLYKHKYESFTVCIKNDCSICRVNQVPERFIFKDRICALHLHSRKFDINSVLSCQNLYRPIYHPLNNYFFIRQKKSRRRYRKKPKSKFRQQIQQTTPLGVERYE